MRNAATAPITPTTVPTSPLARHRPLLMIAAVCLLLPLADQFDAFWRLAFCAPAAHVAAAFLGAPCISTDDGYHLPAPGCGVLVTQACSAARFFILLTVVIAASLLRRHRPVAALLAAPGCAYGLTLGANAMRIVGGWLAATRVAPHFPAGFQPALHTTVGVVVFLSVLVFTHIALTWRTAHAHRA